MISPRRSPTSPRAARRTDRTGRRAGTVSSKSRLLAACVASAIASASLPLRVLNERRPRGGQVAQQLDRAALLRRRPVVERSGIDLGGEMEQEANFLLQQRYQFGLRQHHRSLPIDRIAAKSIVMTMKGFRFVIAALALAGTTVGLAQSPADRGKDLLNGLANPARWLTHSGDYAQHAPQPAQADHPRQHRQARAGVVVRDRPRLRPAGQVRSHAIAIDGTLYVTGLNNHAWAIDGRTGTPIWHYERPLPAALRVCCGMANRGFAVHRRPALHGHARRARHRARPQDGRSRSGTCRSSTTALATPPPPRRSS